jgi:hypothetical protein
MKMNYFLRKISCNNIMSLTFPELYYGDVNIEAIAGGGPQGTQGNQGSQGSQGNQGSQGLQGNQGSQGLQGNQGSQGSQGFQGLQGSQGNQGSQGLQGNQGSQGSQGFQGSQGSQGNQGSQGLQGNQGSQGLQGNQGSQGSQGFQGLQGNQGNQGNQGINPTILGTANQIIVTGSSPVTLSTPQNIATSSNVQFQDVYIGTSTAAFNAPLQFDSSINQRKICLFDGNPGSPNTFQFYGFGINAGVLAHIVALNTANHVFYSAASSTALNTLFTISGNNSGTIMPIGQNCGYSIGSNLIYSYVGSAGSYFTGSAVGDLCIRNASTSNSVNIGVGSSTPQLVINNNNILGNVNLNLPNLILTGYVSGSGSATIVAGNSMIIGTGGSVSIIGNQVGGTLAVSTAISTPVASGVMATITLPSSSPTSFAVLLTPQNSATAILPFYAICTGLSTFTISTATILAVNLNLNWNYSIVA